MDKSLNWYDLDPMSWIFGIGMMTNGVCEMIVHGFDGRSLQRIDYLGNEKY